MKVFYALVNQATNSVINKVELETTSSINDVISSIKSNVYYFSKGLQLLNITEKDLHSRNRYSSLVVQCSYLNTDTLDVCIIPFS